MLEIAAGGGRKKTRGFGGYAAALRQIYIEYHLPISPREITIKEIKFFYEPLVGGLIEAQKAEKRSKHGG